MELLERISASGQDAATTIITVEEQLTGWYALIRQARRRDQIAHAYRQLAHAIRLFATWPALPYTEPEIDRFDALAALKLNIGRMDLRIAAITLENKGILVTRNSRDFARVPNLTIENWAV